MPVFFKQKPTTTYFVYLTRATSYIPPVQHLAREVHLELQPYLEAWAGGIKLKPTSAYGVRMYQVRKFASEPYLCR